LKNSKIWFTTSALALTVCTSVPALAADYIITWKNQFASKAICNLTTTMVTPLGSTPNTVNHTFSLLGQTIPVTLSSPTCTRINLSASCNYTDSKGIPKKNSFGNQTAFCENSTVTLNNTLPGSMTVTPTQSKPRN